MARSRTSDLLHNRFGSTHSFQHTPFMSSAKRPTASNGTAASKKPCLQHAFGCPNPGCNTSFKSQTGLQIHLGKSSTCTRFLMLKTRSRTKTVMKKPPAVEGNEALADVFWDDDEDSIDEEFNQAVYS